MYGKLIISSLALLIASQSAFAAGSGGIVLGATRVVYDANNKEASITINNKKGKKSLNNKTFPNAHLPFFYSWNITQFNPRHIVTMKITANRYL